MADRIGCMPSEFQLLLTCARALPDQTGVATIRRLLGGGIDWSLFVRQAVHHGLTAQAGRMLIQEAADMVPLDIADALRATLDQTSRANLVLADELLRICESSESAGIGMTTCKGRLLAFPAAFGDPGLVSSEEMRFLIREADLPRALAMLRTLGYERRRQLTEGQLNLIHRLEGEEVLSNKALGIGLRLATRLTPLNMSFDLNYAEFWDRLERARLNGRTITLPSAEDGLIILAIFGGRDLWWRACQVSAIAAYIVSHPGLDWDAVIKRARSQGCLRMVLVSATLAKDFLGAPMPAAIGVETVRDPKLERVIRRIAARWTSDRPVAEPSGGVFLDRLWLHDQMGSAVRYIARTSLLPRPHHVSRNPAPRLATSLIAHVPIRFAHDIALPIVRSYRYMMAQSTRLLDGIASVEFLLPIMPVSDATRRRSQRLRQLRRDAVRTLAANPNSAEAWSNLGNALHGLNRHKAAIACYDKALAIAPEHIAIWKKRGAARLAAGGTDPDEEPPLNPSDANGWVRRAGFLLAAQRLHEAAAASEYALTINPRHVIAMRIGIRSRLAACDWRKRGDDERRIREGLAAGLRIITPRNHRAVSASEAESLIAARLWAKEIPQRQALWRNERYRHDRIRVAYLSGEFRDHATSVLIAGVLEHHDKAHFEIVGISMGPDDGSKMRRRIMAPFDRFIDVQEMDDAQVAAMLRQLEVDIAVDLNGHAGAGRPGILAYRPAPVQVNYLGYCGTMGVEFIDYVLADKTVIPEDQAQYYSEKIVYLPNSYQCNDSRRHLPLCALSRSGADLPEKGFVFCCFNNSYKIAPPIFDIWMRLLLACPGSVLWLIGDNAYAIQNLRREAEARGVSAGRLVFARRLPVEEHLARHQLADLFLDTLPFNAHTTASDALWAGLPVLTCTGSTFPGRVAASLLRAVGLEELVTTSLAEYEGTALALARDPERLQRLKNNLAQQGQTAPLFDTARYTSNLESAYTIMWERFQRGESPDSFFVPDRPKQEMAGAAPGGPAPEKRLF